MRKQAAIGKAFQTIASPFEWMYDGIRVALESGIPADSGELLDRIENGLEIRARRYLEKTWIHSDISGRTHDHSAGQADCPVCVYENLDLRGIREFYRKHHPRKEKLFDDDPYFLRAEEANNALIKLRAMRRGDEVIDIDAASRYITQHVRRKRAGEKVNLCDFRRIVTYQGVIIDRVHHTLVVELIPEKEFDKLVDKWKHDEDERSLLRSLFPWFFQSG